MFKLIRRDSGERGGRRPEWGSVGDLSQDSGYQSSLEYESNLSWNWYIAIELRLRIWK